jgi:hypothetical protein
MVEYKIEFENDFAGLDKLKDRLPRFHELLLARLAAKIVANVQINLKRGKYGITSGQEGRTGRLANSIGNRAVGRDGMDLGSGIGFGSPVTYAKFHEFGFSGVVTVKRHTRNQAFGRPTRPFAVGPFSRRVAHKGYQYTRKTLDEFFNSRQHERIALGAFEEFKRREM